MSAPLILAIDQGTTNTKALVVGLDGVVHSRHAERVGIEFPRPGWAQSDPVEILQSVERVIGACLDDLAFGSIVGIGIANQRESVVAWDRATGAPVGPLISWQCNRGAELCARLTTPAAAAFVGARTGLALDPMFSATKMRWLLDEIPNGRERAAAGELCLGTVDSWLLRELTGEFATDMTNASRTLLYDIDAGDWSTELLDLFGIPRPALADIRPSGDVFGTCRIAHPRLAESGSPVAALIGDSHAALFGHGAFLPGALKASFGTGTSVLAPVDGVVRIDRLSSTVGWSRRLPNRTQTVHAVEGNIYATGSALEWVAQLLGLHDEHGPDIGRLEALARQCGDTGGVAFVPALAGLGAPHWDPNARGILSGLTRHAGPPQIARAAFEAVAHQVADVTDEMAGALGRRPDVMHTDGGAMRSDLLANRVADLVAVPLLRAHEPELAGLGAAKLAGLQLRMWTDLDALAALPNAAQRLEPVMKDAARQAQRHQWAEAVSRCILR